jgi:hypothetical protein
MRTVFAATLGFALLSAGAAQAAPVTLGATALAPQAQQKFEKSYGVREVGYLSDYAQSEVSRALTKAGAEVGTGGLRVEVTLLSARPSKPTFKQLGDRVGLDYYRSISLGGAKLQAKFIDASGAVVDTVDGGYYETDLQFAYALSTWYDAERGIRSFARKVGQRYTALHAGRPAV